MLLENFLMVMGHEQYQFFAEKNTERIYLNFLYKNQKE